MRRPLEGDDGGHRRPVGRIGRAGVEELVKGPVGGVAGEVVVVAGVVVAGAAAVVAQRADDGQVVRLLGQVRQVLAEADAGALVAIGLERAAVLGGSVGLHVPGVDVRGAAAEPDQDGRPGDFSLHRHLGRGDVGCRGGQVASEQTEPADPEKGPSIQRIVTRHLASLRQAGTQSAPRLRIIAPLARQRVPASSCGCCTGCRRP